MVQWQIYNEVLLKAHGWGGRRGSGGGTSKKWPKSIPDRMQARVGRPSEKEGPSKLEVIHPNFPSAETGLPLNHLW